MKTKMKFFVILYAKYVVCPLLGFFLKMTNSFLKVFIEFVTMCFGFWAMRPVGSYLLDQGSNLHSVHWKAKS